MFCLLWFIGLLRLNLNVGNILLSVLLCFDNIILVLIRYMCVLFDLVLVVVCF